jgi:hypothetical protein
MKVRSLPAAGADPRSASDYVDQQRGLGGQFAAEFRLAVAKIRASPPMYLRTEDGPDEPENREYCMSRFKYRVIYALWKDEAVIVAVIHARRRRGALLSRLIELDSPTEDLS